MVCVFYLRRHISSVYGSERPRLRAHCVLRWYIFIWCADMNRLSRSTLLMVSRDIPSNRARVQQATLPALQGWAQSELPRSHPRLTPGVHQCGEWAVVSWDTACSQLSLQRCLAVAGRCMYAYKYANVSRGVIASGSYSSPMGILVCVLFVLVVLLYDAFLVHIAMLLDPQH